MKNSLIFGISLIIGFANCSMAQTDTISNNIFQSNGKLGIGQSSPGFLFHIEDSINAGDQQRFVFLNNKSISNTSFVGLSVVSGKNDTYSSFAQFSENYTAIRGMADYCQIYNSGKGIALTSSKDGDIRFMKNESGINSTNMIIKPEGLVGIGTDSPSNALTIEGTETEWPGRIFLSVNNKSTSSKSLAYISAKAGTSANHTIFGHISETYTANDTPEDLQDFGIVSSNGNGLIIGATKNSLKPGIIKFVSGQSSGTTFDERMRIDTTGRIGIGTKMPKAKLDIAGGVKIGNSTESHEGTLRWTGSDFEGYDGSSWLSLTKKLPDSWQTNNNNLFYNLGNIGIGTDSPSNALTIEGTETEWPGRIFLSVNNKSTSSKSLAYISAKAGTSANHTIFGHISETYTANDTPEDLQDFGIVSSNGNGLIIGATKNSLKPGIIKFVSGQSSGTTFDERMRIDTTGRIGIGTKMPKAKLDIAGGVKIGNSTESHEGTLRWTGSDFEGYDGSSWLSLTKKLPDSWQTNNNNLFYNLGNIGIGTDSPSNALTIEGTETEWPGRIFLSVNNKSTSSKSLAYISAKAGTSANHTIFGHISETYTANDTPEDLQDFGIVSSNGNGLIIGATKNSLKPGIIKFVSGQSSGTTFDERMRIDTTGRIGIGTKMPKAKLDIAGGVKIGNSTESHEGTLRWTGSDFEGYDGSSWLSLTKKLPDSWQTNNNNLFYDLGNIGIGTDSPNSKLEITDGDIYINDIEKGIIMKSPDGNCWRGVLDNTGQLNFISIDCPEEKRVNSNQQLKSTENVLVFPNPAQNTITVHLNTQIEKHKYIICNLNGQIMDNGRIRSNIQPIDISELTTGVYMLNIYDKKGNKMTTEKIVKK